MLHSQCKIWVVNPLLKKGVDIQVTKNFIHLENGIYLLALLDGEFECFVARMNPNWGGNFHNWRVSVNLIHQIEKKYRSLFD